MGKVKVKVIGDEQQEEAQKAAEAIKREQKDLRSGKASKVAGIGMKGGERTTSLGVSEEEIAASMDQAPQEELDADGKKKKTKVKKVRVVSLRHKENKALTSQNVFKVDKGIETLRKFKKSNFDETVELHINTKEKGVSGTVQLPHGTGKTLRIAVVDDAIIEEVAAGKINFDVLVAHPSMMPKLARVAKVLGPRGLMPNPKNGTISPNTDDAVAKLSAGQIGFKTESQAPLIHMSVGKLSFEDKKLSDNISTVISAIGASKISAITLKSTMSPAVRLAVSSK
ncbi:MAG: hypothetical protein KA035_02090 [Candidatus Levybacteria bacterium]|nr:hypothetical protein [Candidatus Levybacteria bacterium]